MPGFELTFAIIGCGRIAERHAEHIQNVGKLQAVCDIIPAKAEALGKKYNTKIYYNAEDLLAYEKGLKVVSVCTPNGLHAAHTISALNAGADVLCEKPMAISSYDCGEMIKAAERNNRRLFIVKQNRFNPPVAALKQAIEQGILGRIYNVHVNCFWNRNDGYYHNTWKGTKALDGGILFTQFSHFIDLLYWMVGDVKKAYTLTRNFAHINSIEFEDTGAAILEFYNGAIGNINFTINSFQKNMEGSVTIFTEHGTVKIGGQYLNELEYQNIKDFVIKDLPKGNTANDYGTYTGSMSNHGKVYENLADVLQNGAAISTSAFEGLKTVEIIEKIYASAENTK
ncbi:MAG TPA: Gfo/Idh/MocA family oxidoreductase [Chitinophagaceae bacterium]|nr:Gfo/Idh/MocA family oxidoreductase [Chitinophagaceae bacterium]